MSAHGGGGDRWLVSYADFITLLMVLFVVLYSMGQTDIKKYKQMAESFKAAFSGGPARIVDPSINRNGGLGGEDMGQAAPIVIEGLPQAPNEGIEVAGKLTSLLNQANLSSDVSVQNNVEGMLISLSQKILFQSGTVTLEPDAYPTLDQVVAMLKPLPNEIRVVGHTDNTQPLDPKYANNWDLSLARSMEVINYFAGQGIEMSRLIASGRGDTSPTYSNDNPDMTKLNNRVDIIVMYKIEEENTIDLQLP